MIESEDGSSVERWVLRTMKRRCAHLYAQLFARAQLANFHYFLLEIALKGLGILNYYDLGVSGEDYLISRLMPLLVENDPPVFFDVGANEGEYTRMLASTFPAARIYAFEPHPSTYRILSRSKSDRVRTFRIALGERPGRVRLYDRADADGSSKASLYKGVLSHLRDEKSRSHMVSLRTLDQISETLGVGSLDLLKIDTEGSELAVLRGARSLLEQGRIGTLHFEFNEMNAISKSMFGDFRELLAGWSFFRLLPRGLLPVPKAPLLSELYGYQNILAIRSERVRALRDRPVGRQR